MSRSFFFFFAKIFPIVLPPFIKKFVLSLLSCFYSFANNWLYICMNLCWSSLYCFHWSICLFFDQDHTVLIISTLEKVFKSDSVSLQTVFLLPRCCGGYFRLFWVFVFPYKLQNQFGNIHKSLASKWRCKISSSLGPIRSPWGGGR